MAAALARQPRNDDDALAPPLHDAPSAHRDLAHSRSPATLADAVRAVARATATRPWLVPTSLFLLGYALSLLIVNLHTQHHVTHYDRLGSAASSARIAVSVPPPPPLPPPPSASTILARPPRFAHSWLPLVGAVSAVLVGIAYLIADACAGDLGRRPPSAAATAGLLSRRGSVSEAAGRFLVVSLSSTSLASLVAPTQRTDTCPLPPRWGTSSNSAAPSRTASSTGVRRGGGPRMVLLDDADVADPDDVDDELSGAADVAPISADVAPGSMAAFAAGATAAAAEGDPPRTSVTARLRYRSKRGLILRCLGGVVGINYAVSKVPAHPYLLSAALLALALAVFSMVDRTRRGFLVSLFVAAVGTLVCHSLTLAGYLAFVQPDLLGTIKAWVPVLIFTTAVGVGMVVSIVNPPRDAALLVLGASLPLAAALTAEAIKHLVHVSPAAWTAVFTDRTARPRPSATDYRRKLAILAWMQTIAAVAQLGNQITFVVINTMPAAAMSLSCDTLMGISSFWFNSFQALALPIVIIRATGMLPTAVMAPRGAHRWWAIWRHPRRLARVVLLVLYSVTIAISFHTAVVKVVSVSTTTGLCATVYPWTNNISKLVIVVMLVLVAASLVVPLVQHLRNVRGMAPTPSGTAKLTSSATSPAGNGSITTGPNVSTLAATMAPVRAIINDQAVRFALAVAGYLVTSVLGLVGVWPGNLSVISFTLQNYLCMLTATARVNPTAAARRTYAGAPPSSGMSGSENVSATSSSPIAGQGKSLAVAGGVKPSRTSSIVASAPA
ncbi:hypothetical protein GGF31_007040 [Allomyces arbusculus]|nr:hypothetical protein GGF31_007040 [Allomyces arbusculus]